MLKDYYLKMEIFIKEKFINYYHNRIRYISQ